MPRPPRARTIDHRLEERVFKPRGIPTDALDTVVLALDELEALRLVDREGLYQQEAARMMGVSRPTLARILAGARWKVAVALTEGRALVITGGPIERTRRRDRALCPVHGGGRRRGRACHCRGRRHHAAPPAGGRRRKGDQPCPAGITGDRSDKDRGRDTDGGPAEGGGADRNTE